MARRMIRGWLWSILIGVFCLGASPAAAVDGETLAGYSSDFGNSSYTYAGVGMEEPISSSFALRARLLFSFVTFEFKENGKNVEAEAPALTALVGLKYHLRPGMSLSLFGGGQIKRTHFDRETSDTRNDDGGVAQAEFHYQLSPKSDLLVLYTYSSADHFSWGRVAAKREVLAFGPRGEFGLGVGLEAIGMGGEDFMAGQGGPLLEIHHRPTNGSFVIGFGPKYFTSEGTRETRPYLSLNMYFPF